MLEACAFLVQMFDLWRYWTIDHTSAFQLEALVTNLPVNGGHHCSGVNSVCVDLVVVIDSENGEQHESDHLKVQLLEHPESADGLSHADHLLRG